ncbi:hypothetical protein EOA28_31280, partial [Mesorhizobium sp. M2A.F.Ca.ET.067.02.1.1]
HVISPLEGEMSPKATEGVAAREAPTSICGIKPSPVGPTPSGLPAISPSRGEITRSFPHAAGCMAALSSMPNRSRGSSGSASRSSSS